MCDTRLNELCRLMIAQDARIRGRSACFENDQEVCTVLPMLYPIDPIDLSMLVAKLKIGSADADADVKPMVQVLMPASSTPILIKNNDELLPPIIATLGQPIINPVIIGTPPLPVPLMLTTTTTTTTTTPAPPIQIDTTTITTTSSTTLTTTSTTPPPATSSTTIQIPVVEMVTTTAPTTITSSTAMPQPNDTLVLDIEEPHLRPNETQESHGNAIPNNNSSSDNVELPLPAVEHEVSQPEQAPLVEAGERVVEHVADTVPDTVAKTEYETVEYIPNVVLAPPATPPSSKTNLLEEDSQDSQSNSVLPGDLEHAAQDLQIPEEPPEE